MKKKPIFHCFGVILIIVITLVLLIPMTGDASDERGIRRKNENKEAPADNAKAALVIGNAAYKEAPLKNPLNDADDMSALLKKKGFHVILLKDATQRQMKDAIRDFGKSIKPHGASLFFYAGHGIGHKGVNYLVPVDARIEDEDEIKHEAVNANRVLDKMESAGSRLNMVFLDACRNNPFARSFRSASNGGLTTMDAPTGTLIGFATAPEKTASDGDGRNGTYTKFLLKYMNTKGLELMQMMKAVRGEVLQSTHSRQTPWENSSVIGDFYFTPGDPNQATQSVVTVYVPQKSQKHESVSSDRRVCVEYASVSSKDLPADSTGASSLVDYVNEVLAENGIGTYLCNSKDRDYGDFIHVKVRMQVRKSSLANGYNLATGKANITVIGNDGRALGNLSLRKKIIFLDDFEDAKTQVARKMFKKDKCKKLIAMISKR